MLIQGYGAGASVTAAGVFADIEAAKSIMIKRTGSYEPDMERHALYNELYSRYERLYEAVRPLM